MALSPADRQVEANGDVERIARELCASLNRAYGDTVTQLDNMGEYWDTDTFADLREKWLSVARDLLKRDVIRVGHRPNSERPIEGQTTLEDQCVHVWETGKDECQLGCGASYIALHGPPTIGDWQCDVCGEPLTQHAKACEGWTPPDQRVAWADSPQGAVEAEYDQA